MPRSWFGKAPEPSPEVASALADLDRLARDRPELEAPARTLARVLGAAFRSPTTDGSRHAASVEEDRGRIPLAASSGVPYFRRHPPTFDRPALNDRGAAICAALAPDLPEADRLRREILRSRDLLDSWAHAMLAGHPDVVAQEARALDLDPALTASALRLAMLPSLAACSAAVAPWRPDGLWDRGDCPNCAGPPILAESRGLEQRRFLRCGLCAADWPADRLRCPSCGEADHRALTSLSIEGEEAGARLIRCSTCGLALKVVSTLGPLSAPGLLVMDLATIHLDLIAGDAPEPS